MLFTVAFVNKGFELLNCVHSEINHNAILPDISGKDVKKRLYVCVIGVALLFVRRPVVGVA